MLVNFIKSAKFLISKQTQEKNSYVNISDAPESKDFGVLFVLIENKGPFLNEQTFSQIFSTIEYYYYHVHNHQGGNLVTNFEKSLKSLNEEILKLIQEEELQVDLTQLDILIGLVYPTLQDNEKFDIHLSSHGKLKAGLIHQMQLNTHKFIDVTGEPNPEDIQFSSIFSNIISGQISEKDVLLVTNPTTLDFLSEKDITNMLSRLAPEPAALQFKNLLERYNEEFAGVIIKPTPNLQQKTPLTPPPAIEQNNPVSVDTQTQKTTGVIDRKRKKSSNSESSLKNLISTEKQTDKILSPLLEVNLKKIYKNSKVVIITIAKKIASPNINLSVLKKPSLSGRLPKGPTLPLNSIKPRNIIQSFFDLFTGLNNKSRTFLFASIILFLMFYISTAWISGRQEKQKQEEEYRRTVKTIVNKKYQAESSIIYQEESKAKDILNEIQSLLVDLPTNSPERKDFKETTANEIESLLEEVRKIVTLENLENITELPNKNFTEFALLDDELYTYTENELYQVSLDEKDFKRVAVLEAEIKEMSASEKNIFFLDTNNKIYKFSNGELLELESNILTQTVISDSTFYNNKLYLLSPSNNQIYKYRVGTESISLESAWIKDNLNVKNGKSITIDGSIYVLAGDKNILTLRNGFETNKQMSLDIVDPPLSKADKIYASPENNVFYILDKEQNRIILTDKNNKLQKQYQSEEFKGIQDFLIDSSETQMYILTSDKILRTELLNQ